MCVRAIIDDDGEKRRRVEISCPASHFSVKVYRRKRGHSAPRLDKDPDDWLSSIHSPFFPANDRSHLSVLLLPPLAFLGFLIPKKKGQCRAEKKSTERKTASWPSEWSRCFVCDTSASYSRLLLDSILGLKSQASDGGDTHTTAYSHIAKGIDHT